MTFSEMWADYKLTFGPFDSSYVEAGFRREFAKMWNAATEEAAKVAKVADSLNTTRGDVIAREIRKNKEADRGTE